MEGENMILWLNGPYGVGKSTLAEALHAAMPDSFIFDAEQVGNAIRDNLPKVFYRETFEEFPLWHDTCVQLLTRISRGYAGHVLVPMTLALPESAETINRIRQQGADVRHVILTAEADEILRRIVAREEAPDCWCARQIGRCLAAQAEMSCDLRLPATEAPDALAARVIAAFDLA